MTIDSLDEFKEAVSLVDILLDIHNLAEPLDLSLKSNFKFPQINKAFEVISIMRSYYSDLIRTDRDPYQLFVGLMRYSMHTLSFDESNEWQKN